MRRSYFFDRALLPSGWRRDVRLVSEGGTVTKVTPDAKPQPDDLREHTVIPGVPNLHSHSFQRAMAGLTEHLGSGEDNFWSWRDLMYRFASQMGPDDVQAIAAYAFADMLEGGFTTVGEFHYIHRDPQGAFYADPAELSLRNLAAAADTGVGITLLPVFYAASDFGGAAPKPGQKRFINSVETFADIVARAQKATADRPAARVGVAPHSLRAAPPEALKALPGLPADGPVHIHIAEQTKEVQDCIAWSGKRPVEWLLENMSVDERWCLVHATHMTPDETQGLVDSGAVAGLCPITEANLGDGLFPARAFLEAGGRFGVGSDSNVEIDAAGELRLLEYGQRLLHRARNVLASPKEVSTGGRLYNGALAGGAQALGLTGVGFSVGAQADFIVLDMDQPDLGAASEDKLVDTWIFSTGRRGIRKVVAAGETVVENGRHKDRTRIDAAYRAAVSRL